MLKFFVTTVETLVIAAIITGALRGYAKLTADRLGKIFTNIGALLGIIAACVMAYLKNATKLIDTSLWNLYIFGIFAGLVVLWVIFAPLQGKLKTPGRVIASCLAALMTADILFYALPDIAAMPYSILVTDKSVLSTGYLFKLIGVILGLIAVLLLQLAVRCGMERLGKWQGYFVTAVMLLVGAVKQVCALLGIMFTKRMLEKLSAEKKHMVFEIVKDTANTDLFVYLIIAAAAAVAVMVFIGSLRKDEPYDNLAQKRKILKKHKVSRRWAALAVVCAVLCFCSFTVLEPIANKVVSLSPVEKCTEKDGNMCVTFDQVEDGHLHRFAYVSPSGIQIRFIVIKKPNSSAYGIGLDACDICGETGYYETDGQVVCKLCDVVMNINTIGFKGGCNPIVIPYEVKDGEIKVPIDGLMEHEQMFKNNRMAKEMQ